MATREKLLAWIDALEAQRMSGLRAVMDENGERRRMCIGSRDGERHRLSQAAARHACHQDNQIRDEQRSVTDA